MDQERETPRLAGRYEIDRRIGVGGFGEVWSARDRVTGDVVAVKRFVRTESRHVLPARAEIAHLRLLRFPGVAQLFDEGLDGDVPFLVMELVEGEPFPGLGPDGEERFGWEAVEPVARDLLEIVGRVHDAGIVHLDLKPANVLVDAAGRVTVLDFGLAAARRTEEGGPRAFTPAFAAPEQLRGAAADQRSDLFAIGRMLRDALEDGTPLEPASLTPWLHSLTATDPARRPRSAQAALAALEQDAGLAPTTFELPWLGARDAIDRALEALAAGRRTTVAGSPGSGKTRLATEVTAALEGLGRRTIWLEPASVPFESLANLAGWLADLEPANLAAARAGAAAALARAASEGVVLVADDIALDRWSADLVAEGYAPALLLGRTATALGERLVAAGADTWRPGEDPVAQGADCTESHVEAGRPLHLDLLPLTRVDLHALFQGPDRILHLAEDGAAELYRRTGGRPAAVAAEVTAWVRAGLAHWAHDEHGHTKLAVDRPSLGRLAGGRPLASRPPLEPNPDAPELSPEHREVLSWLDLLADAADEERLAALTGHPPWMLEAELADLEHLDAIERTRKQGRTQLRLLRSVRPPCYASPDDSNHQIGSHDAQAARHAAVAALLVQGHRDRLGHLLLAPPGETAAQSLIEEARISAKLAMQLPDLDQAEWRLDVGLRTARQAGSPTQAEPIALAWAQLAQARFTAAAFDRVLTELDRFEQRTPNLENLATILRAGLHALEGHPAAGTRLLDDLGTSELDEPTGRLAWGLRVVAARSLPLDEESELLSRARAWCESQVTPMALANYHEWWGLHLYRTADYSGAALSHSKAAGLYRDPASQASAKLNEAASLLDALDPGRALAVLEEMRASIENLRVPLFELRHEVLSCAAVYRSGDELSADADLLQISENLGYAALNAQASIYHAAAAWRREDLGLAFQLASRAAAIWRKGGALHAAFLAEALGLRCKPGGTTTEARQSLERELSKATPNRMTEQARRLLGLAASAVELPTSPPATDRLEVLTLGELRSPNFIA